MAFDSKRSRAVFEGLNRQVSKLSKASTPTSVHKFRTRSRRVETILRELAVERSRNDKKLLKLLKRCRRKAGKVRDLDVQINGLRNLKVPEQAGHKAQLLRVFTGEREQREKKLAKALDGKTLHDIKRRLKKAERELVIPDSRDPIKLALNLLADLAKHTGALTEKTLHQQRILGKRARYLAELASQDPGAECLVQQLKHVQNLIGDWHDWWKLTARAEELLGAASDSALVALLRNLTRAKFRQAVAAVAEARTQLTPPAPRKIVSSVSAPAQAVA